MRDWPPVPRHVSLPRQETQRGKCSSCHDSGHDTKRGGHRRRRYTIPLTITGKPLQDTRSRARDIFLFDFFISTFNCFSTSKQRRKEAPPRKMHATPRLPVQRSRSHNLLPPVIISSPQENQTNWLIFTIVAAARKTALKLRGAPYNLRGWLRVNRATSAKIQGRGRENQRGGVSSSPPIARCNRRRGVEC